jgi:predicted ATP-binding protein involved in virulence
MIRVKQLHLENVGPFSAQDFDFSVEKGHPDIHIFTGINGTGKTTILHAIAAMFDHFESPGHHKEYSTNNFQKRIRSFYTVDGNFDPRSSIATLEGKQHGAQVRFELYGCAQCRNVHRRQEAFFLEQPLDHPEGRLDSNVQQVQYSSTYTGPIRNPLNFAAFGYSGYRFISSTPIQLGNEDNFNPLHQALEFLKKSDSSSNISNWIVSRHVTATIEESKGNKETARKFREALDALLKNIEALTDNQFTFEIQTNPLKVAIKYFEQEVEFDVLPDGLRSILSWMGDLLMRLDYIPWVDKSIPVNKQHIILLLDEIEVHLHPKWQYQILPLTQKIFPNAQIFLTTHSPFILNSIDNAKIYKLKTEKGEASLDDVELSETGNSYSYIYENILETHNMFGYETTQDLKLFNEIDKEIAKQDYSREAEFIEVTQNLLKEGLEVTSMISSKLMRLKRITGKDYFHGENHEKAAV